jgi:glycerate dehydrogenase
MKAVFLDYATVSFHGDLDPTALRQALPGLDLRAHTPQGEVAEAVARAEVILVNKLRISREVMERAPGLRLVVLAATGTNNVDLTAARERGIAVCNLRDYCTASVVQHVFGLLLALTQRLREYDGLVRSGAWQRGEQFCLLDFPIRELTGRRLVIVGYGTLGKAVAHAARAFGMEVLVANRPGGERVAGRLDLAQLLPQADVLSLHCPLTPHTQGLIGAAELARMNPDAVLINTARGALVDAAALVDALRARRLGGAGIDVLAQEPPVDGSPLLAGDISNLIVTPHVAWAAREARQRCLDEMAANVEDYRRGGHRGRVV